MRKYIKISAAALACALLCGCSLLRENASDTLAPYESYSQESAETVPDTEEPAGVSETEVEETVTAAAVGLYDDIGDVGVYTRLDTWSCAWKVGVDLAVFDILPTDAEKIEHAGAYRELWSKLSTDETSPSLVLEYTADGHDFCEKLSSWEDAERVISDGYIEVYLYDDVHQEAGAWYSHLTEADTTEQTVISSVKLTGGAKIDAVEKLSLTAYLGEAEGGSVELFRK